MGLEYETPLLEAFSADWEADVFDPAIVARSRMMTYQTKS